MNIKHIKIHLIPKRIKIEALNIAESIKYDEYDHSNVCK